MRNKLLNIFSLTFNAMISVCSVVSFIIMFLQEQSSAFTTISPYVTLVILVSALVGMSYNIKTFSNDKICTSRWAQILKLSTVGISITTMIVSIFFIENGLIDKSYFITRLILPILLLLDFMFVEFDDKYPLSALLFAPAFFILSVGIIMVLDKTGSIQAGEEYLKASVHTWYVSVLLLVIIICSSIIVCFLARLINSGFRYLIVSRKETTTSDDDWGMSQAEAMKAIKDREKNSNDNVEPKENDLPSFSSIKTEDVNPKSADENTSQIVEESSVVKEEEPSEIENAKTDKKETTHSEDKTSKTDKKEPVARVYHVSHHKTENKWQIKLAGSNRATKLFKTQKEAIEYANALTKTQGGSVLVHGVNGRIRKA